MIRKVHPKKSVAGVVVGGGDGGEKGGGGGKGSILINHNEIKIITYFLIKISSTVFRNQKILFAIQN